MEAVFSLYLKKKIVNSLLEFYQKEFTQLSVQE